MGDVTYGSWDPRRPAGGGRGSHSWGKLWCCKLGQEREETGLSLAMTGTRSGNGLGDSHVHLSGGWGSRAVALTDVLVDD